MNGKCVHHATRLPRLTVAYQWMVARDRAELVVTRLVLCRSPTRPANDWDVAWKQHGGRKCEGNRVTKEWVIWLWIFHHWRRWIGITSRYLWYSRGFSCGPLWRGKLGLLVERGRERSPSRGWDAGSAPSSPRCWCGRRQVTLPWWLWLAYGHQPTFPIPPSPLRTASIWPHPPPTVTRNL